uniref:Uncharacterized protein n=1 Tax=Plantago major TaxID=29818 RepID=Q1EMM3_PLAMJ|nr:hypothetical protein 11 [Plantago major]
MSTALSQLSCFSSITTHRRSQLNFRSATNFRPGKILNASSSDGRGIEVSDLENKTIPSYKEDASTLHDGSSIKSHPVVESSVVSGLTDLDEQKQVVSPPQKAAKIHDFCFGIPFGGLVLSGGLLGFVFSRNLATLSSGVLFGGALLGLSTFSLKVWRQGKSSIPFILGQAVLAVALLLKNLKTYSLNPKLFPTGFNIVVSAAMLCFYCYVVLSGGNPPPKKLKSSAVGAAY